MIVCLAAEDSDVVQVISTLFLYGTCNEMFCIQQRLQLLTESYLENGEEPFTVDILKEMTSKYLALICVFETSCVFKHFSINLCKSYIVDCVAWQNQLPSPKIKLSMFTSQQ